MAQGKQLDRVEPEPVRSLHRLAKLYGVQRAYSDVITGQRQTASLESLLAVLRALGAPLERLGDAAAAVQARQQALQQRWVEPVTVCWEGRGSLALRLPAHKATGFLACRLKREDGSEQQWRVRLDQLRILRPDQTLGQKHVVKRLSLPEKLPHGYHQLHLEHQGRVATSLLLAAPVRAFTPADGQAEGTWGVFLPMHALRTAQSWGTGDYGDLEKLTDWVRRLGGSVVATLPFLAAFLDEPCEPSPYAPVSRLFWNELFLDLHRIPELEASPAAKSLLASPELQGQVEGLRAASEVDYRRALAVKRRVLTELLASLLASTGERRKQFEHFVETHPLLQDYARFRAVGERLRQVWRVWPDRLRGGAISDSDFEERTRDYHLYVQWLSHQQLQHFAERARQAGPGLYLDLPLGVHPDGFDVWRFREIFAGGVSGGAPPDSFFTKGQDWGFPPLHPESVREHAHRYFISCIRHQLRYSGILRIDHVMGLHRLFWVPHGMKAVEGVYVRYPAEEYYAILALESCRHQALIVGEDLGTVPPYVRPAMARHALQRSYVAQFEIQPDSRQTLRAASRDTLASLNTHDMPTFAGFWQGLDIQDRVEMGLLAATDAAAEQQRRDSHVKALGRFLRRKRWLNMPEATPSATLQACLAHLGAGRARVVTVNLEDLWGETLPQNVPGTTTERPNWRRKARYSLEEFARIPYVLETLARLDGARRKRREKVRPARQRG